MSFPLGEHWDEAGVTWISLLVARRPCSTPRYHLELDSLRNWQIGPRDDSCRATYANLKAAGKMDDVFFCHRRLSLRAGIMPLENGHDGLGMRITKLRLLSSGICPDEVMQSGLDAISQESPFLEGQGLKTPVGERSL